MIWIRIVIFSWLLAVCFPDSARAQGKDEVLDFLVRLLSPELRRVESRLEEIERETKPLPEVSERPWGSRYGHRSADLPDRTTPDWIQVDLGERKAVDMVALMPANYSKSGQEGAGYGFPKRFRVEIADYPDMREATILVEESESDVPNPGRYPLVFAVEPATGRYLRFTSLKHEFDKRAYFWALEELLVGQGNLVIGRGMKITYSSSTELFPDWVPSRVMDGQSTLGTPVDVTVPSPSRGYLSAKLTIKKAKGPLPPEHMKWCAVDLGKPQLIEQVRLLPIESDEYETVGGRGFPRRLFLELANDPDFQQVIWRFRTGDFVLGYPGGNAVAIDAPKVEAQYVRVLVDDMWSRDGWYGFGLSELQVYGDDENLALGKRVYVKDAVDKPPESGWAPENLVDGFTSRYQLIEWPEYLKRMAQRGRLELEKSLLVKRRAAKLSLGKKMLVGAGGLLTTLAVAAWVWQMIRHRLIRRREVEQLRLQIARDLHDDIGSNLGGIELLSEIGSQHSTDKESRNDFEAIRKAAHEASTSMRDIVWLIQEEAVGLKDFITKMRQSVRMILKHLEVSLEVVPENFRDRPLGLLFRRHVFLAFKEVLNNVRKHAQTGAVKVKVEIEADVFRFMVRDEGAGFDPEANGSAGCGMSSLKGRASKLSGRISINTAPGKGTEVIFEAPLS